jgi:hypothetical protein
MNLEKELNNDIAETESYQVKHYKLNKEKYHEKILCELCNCYYKKYNKYTHTSSKKHQNAIMTKKLREDNEKLAQDLKENKESFKNKIQEIMDNLK